MLWVAMEVIVIDGWRLMERDLVYGDVVGNGWRGCIKRAKK